MWRRARRMVAILLAIGFLLLGAAPVRAADPDIDRLLQAPVGKDWVTNGGNLTNQRYSTLKQIDTSNVKQLKGAWMTRLKGSGFGGKYSAEATPLVKDGIMYMVTGNDDAFASTPRPAKSCGSVGRVSTRRSQRCAVAGSTAAWRWARECCFSVSSTQTWSP
jgi:glucose dehydrogenase